MRAVLCSFALLLATAIEVRAASELPAPSGEFPVGTRTFQWSHSDGNERRELIAQLWYPAAVAGGARADYAPYYEEFDGLKSHSVTDASLAATPRTLPVVIISPGRGVPHHFYTTLAESLASHGYVAMAIDYPQIGRVRYPDGRYIPPDDRFAIPFDILVGPYEQVDAFFEEATRLGSADAEASLRELTALNGNANDPFYQRLDLSRLGAFGHSLGARIIGQTVARDARFVAFASMEGVPPRAARRGGLDAAVLMLSSSELPDMAQANIRELLPARRNIVYLVTLNGFGHNSPTELALLLPAEYSYQIPALEGLQSSVALIKEFFDEQLRKLPDAHMRSFVDGTRIVLETFDE
tara:strand:- start:747 stop:1805 length:1059 start_codon:yes stop_codon:yes gene_type:complete